MADPNMVSLAADTWTLVASSVTTGVIHIKDKGTRYLHTYVDTGNAAPTDDSKAVAMSSDTGVINAVNPIDVYIKAVGETGEIRVDL